MEKQYFSMIWEPSYINSWYLKGFCIHTKNIYILFRAEFLDLLCFIFLIRRKNIFGIIFSYRASFDLLLSYRSKILTFTIKKETTYSREK